MTSRAPAPYDDADGGDAPAEGEISERSRGVAVVLGLLGGPLGLHRFYTGRVSSGILMIVTVGGLGVWWLYDMVMLVAGEFRDAEDLPVREWAIAESSGGGARGAEVARLARDLEALRLQVGEMAERLDFAERLLAQQKERTRLPRSE